MTSLNESQKIIKDKWLAYYQSNREWLQIMMDETGSGYVSTDNGRRPNSFLILGVILALYPEANEILLTFCKLNTDEDKLVEVLGLDFDPEKELKK